MSEMLYCEVCPFHTNFGQFNLNRHRRVYNHYKKENKMENQMEQVWRSKDGKCTGSKEEVEAYLATLSPLGKMRFPYHGDATLRVFSNQGPFCVNNKAEVDALIAFANLTPLIQEALTAWNTDIRGWREEEMLLPENTTIQRLLLAYEEALKLVPR